MQNGSPQRTDLPRKIPRHENSGTSNAAAYNMAMLTFGSAVSSSCIALMISLSAWAQPAGSNTFEVASIKPSPPPTGNMFRMGMSGGPGSTDPGRITCDNMALRDLIQRAYALKSYQITGPDWMTSARYDIVAKVPANATKEQVLVMWQNLLADRFKIAVHRETKEMPIYALVIGKGGPKFSEAPPDDPAAATSGGGSSSGSVSFSGSPSSSSGGGAAVVSFSRSGAGGSPVQAGRSSMSGDKMLMSSLAESMTRSVDRPVIDETGLTGKYKIKLEWQREDLSAAAPEGAVLPTIFAAVQEQLGLKLEPRRGPIEILVVDHAEKNPVEN
jgi:uncharacterized protein (TIGR03435 family)